MNPIRLIKIAAQARPDGEGVFLTIGTKYAGETVYSITPELVEDLLADLQRLNSSAALPRPAATTNSTPSVATTTASPPATADTTATTPAGSIAVRQPKRWMLGNALPKHPMVVLIIDPQTDQQAGYAFNVKAAHEMAVNFVKNADAIAAHLANNDRGSYAE